MERRTAMKTIALGAALAAAPGELVNAQSGVGPKQRHSGRLIEVRDGTKLYYRDWGVGKPVVFCHPWALNADIWEYQMLELSEHGMRCVAYDRRGHGRSEDPWRGYDFDTLADDLADVIEQLDLRDVTLVGYSMGSGEVTRYVSRHGPGRISRVVFVSPIAPGVGSRASSDKFITALKKDRPAFMVGGLPLFVGRESLVSPAMSQWILGQFLRSSPSAIIDCMRNNATADLRPYLASLTMPTLIVQGDRDEVSPLELTGRKLVEAISGSKLVIYEGAPHGIVVTHRDRFTQELLSFVPS
jgi:non-heme chloroperoxidase